MVINYIYSGQDVMKMTFYFLCSNPNSSPQCNHEKLSDESQLRDILQNTGLLFLISVRIIKNYKSLRNSHSQEELNDHSM